MGNYKTSILLTGLFIVNKNNIPVSKIHNDCRMIILIDNRLIKETNNNRTYLCTLPFLPN